MSPRLSIFAILVLGLMISSGQAQSALLKESLKKGDCLKMNLSMKLEGKLQFRKDGKPLEIPLQVNAEHVLTDRVLNQSTTGLPVRVARHYAKAKAEFTVQGKKSERTFRKDCEIFVLQRAQGEMRTWCLTQALLRHELELTQHLDTMALTGLLPGKEVKVGDKWHIDNSVAQALCHFEGTLEHSLQGRLEKVEKEQATIEINGKAKGLELGALVELEIQATLTFDLKAKRITRVEWSQKDHREQGPVSPAMTATVKTTLTREKVAALAALNDTALKIIAGTEDISRDQARLSFHDPREGMSFLHDQSWHYVMRSGKSIIMRLLERGNFIAQLQIQPWSSAAKGEHLSIEALRKATKNLPGWVHRQEIGAEEISIRRDLWIYRLTAKGDFQGKESIRKFYFVAAPSGKQILFIFTLPPVQAERLGNLALGLVDSLQLK